MYTFKNKFPEYTFLLLLFAVVFLSSCHSSKSTSKTASTEKGSASKSDKIKQKYAGVLNVKENEIDNVKLYAFIDEWYGTPYKYGGQNKKGIDCSNFSAILYKQIYNVSIQGSSSAIFDQCKTISKKHLNEGDLLFFKIDDGKISHIGVYLQNNKFVHATTKKGVMIDDMDEPYYKKYFYKVGRVK
jgi:lipoprotein Spr